MKRLLSLFFLIVAATTSAQQLSTTFEPYIRSVPTSVKIIECSDGNFLLFGQFDTYGSTVQGKLIKIDSKGNLVAGFQKTLFDALVAVATELPSGKILVSGSFTKLNGVAVAGLVRLNADGSLDDTFQADPATKVATHAVQSTGKIIIVTSASKIKRLNADGSVDNTFDTGATTMSGVSSIVIDASDRIYYQNYNEIDRFTADGPKDNTFNFVNDNSSTIYSFTLLADGRSLVSTTSYASSPATNALFRINNDGSVDNTFVSPTANGQVMQTTVRNGKIVLVGNYTNYNGEYASGAVIELNDNGSYGKELARSDYNGMNSIYLDSHNNLYVAGGFKTISDVEAPFVARIKPDNSIDSEFQVKTYDATGPIGTMGFQSGRPLIAGGYYLIGVGDDHSKIIRLNSDGTSDPTFDPGVRDDQNNFINPTINSVATQEDDKIIIAGSRIFPDQSPFGRLLPDGTIDQNFKTGTGPTVSVGRLPAIAFVKYANSKIYLFGQFDQFDGHNSPGFAVLDKDGTWISGNSSVFTLDSWVQNIKVQSDGKLLVEGYGFANGISKEIIRLNVDGTLDDTFQLSVSGLYDFDVDVNDNLWVAVSQSGKGVLKLDKNGARQIDPVFSTFFFASTYSLGVFNIATVPGGRLAIGGAFNKYNGNDVAGFVIINEDGSVVDYSPVFERGSYVNGLYFNNNTLYIKGKFSEDNGAKLSSIRRIVYDIQSTATTLTATPASEEKISLSWNGGFVGADNIKVERSASNDANYQLVANISAGARALDATGLTEATKYYFRLTASNEFYSATPLVANATTPIKKANALQPSELTTSSFVANWEYLAGTDSVMLQVSQDNFTTFVTGFDKKIVKGASLKITGLKDGQAYQYRVKRYKNGLSSEYSSPVVATVITGLGEEPQETIVLYPNPASDYVTVQKPSNAKVILRTTMGAVLAQQTEAKIDVTSIERGLYIITVEWEGRRRDFKLVKN